MRLLPLLTSICCSLVFLSNAAPAPSPGLGNLKKLCIKEPLTGGSPSEQALSSPVMEKIMEKQEYLLNESKKYFKIVSRNRLHTLKAARDLAGQGYPVAPYLTNGQIENNTEDNIDVYLYNHHCNNAKGWGSDLAELMDKLEKFHKFLVDKKLLIQAWEIAQAMEDTKMMLEWTRNNPFDVDVKDQLQAIKRGYLLKTSERSQEQYNRLHNRYREVKKEMRDRRIALDILHYDPNED